MTNAPTRRLSIGNPFRLVLIGMLLGLVPVMSSSWNRWQSRQKLIAEIEAMGGQVAVVRGGPAWLNSLVGNGLPVEHCIVYLNDRQEVGNGWLQHLTQFRDCDTLFLARTQITDKGLGQLEYLKKLKGLQLESTNITDHGLHHLENMIGLEWLALTDTKITDEGVARLRTALPNCRIKY